MSAWPAVKLGDVVRHVPRPVDVQFESMYREMGIRSHGKGVFHKAPVSGAELGDKRVFFVEPGDFVLNIVFAWEGAVALVSEAERGMIASHRFPTFRSDEQRLDLRFLLLFFRMPRGVELLGRVSPGGAGRNRTLNRSAFLSLEIPLPPLPEQQRLVTWIDELASTVRAASTLSDQTNLEIDALVASASNEVFTTLHAAGNSVVALEALGDIRSGVTLGRTLSGQTIRLPYLRVANVQDGRLDLEHVKQVEVLDSERDKWKLLQDDLLLTEGGDWDKLGRCALWTGAIDDCIHQNHIFRVRLDRSSILPTYLARLIGSPVGKAYFQTAAKQTTNLASINQRQLRAFPVPLPPLAEQHRIVAELDSLQAEVDALKAAQAASRAELDALLPAVLDRAFAGAL